MCFKQKYNEALAEIERLHVEVADLSAALLTAEGKIASLTEENEQMATNLAEAHFKYENLANNCYVHDDSGRIVHFRPEKRKSKQKTKPNKEH